MASDTDRSDSGLSTGVMAAIIKRSWLLEQCDGNRVALSDVSCVVDVQMVSAVIAVEQPRGAARVSHRRIEIDHGIEFTAATDPRVELFTHALFLGSEEVDVRRREDGSLERWNGRPDDSNPLLVSTRDELTIAGDQTLDAHCFSKRYERARNE